MIVVTHECWQNSIMDESLGDLQRLRGCCGAGTTPVAGDD